MDFTVPIVGWFARARARSFIYFIIESFHTTCALDSLLLSFSVVKANLDEEEEAEFISYSHLTEAAATTTRSESC